jgi:tetratricopeptide (TPR) repeat protein
MLAQITRSRRPFVILWVAAFALMLGGGGLVWWLVRNRFRQPVRVLLITPLTASPTSGWDAAELRALGAVVQDHLEVGGGCAVTAVTEAPTTFGRFRNGPRTLLIQLEPRREGMNLVLAFRFMRGLEIPKVGSPSWTQRNLPPLPPAEAFHAFMTALPEHMDGHTESLVPKDSAAFWDLLRASSWRLQNTRLDEATAVAERVTQAEPTCASAALLLGNLRYRTMLNQPGLFRQERARAEADLKRAVDLVPAYPRPAFLLALLQSDSGNHREALEMLIRARRLQPANPMLLTGIAYAARGAGLLPLSRKAMDLRDDLVWRDLQPQAVDITCLYTGELPRFEASLKERPGHLSSTSGVLSFYRGYAGLVTGDRDRAQREFGRAASLANGYPNIQRLSEIYTLILDSRTKEAWVKLHEYDQERVGMWEPDGEFTLRLAEAYATMGDRATAMEMAIRAFARGFGCTDWYERSPMLSPLRNLPKWRAFMQHVRERQKLMEIQFPMNVLDEN